MAISADIGYRFPDAVYILAGLWIGGAQLSYTDRKRISAPPILQLV